MGQKNKKVQTTPTLSEYLAQRAQQVRDSAANVYILKNMPEVPIIPAQNNFSKGLAWLGLSDDARLKIAGKEETPLTCIYTTTSQYGDEGAKVPGNITFKNNPRKYGFEPIPMNIDSIGKGDLIQFAPSKKKDPIHAGMVTGTYKDEFNDRELPTLTYSRGGTGITTQTDEGNKPTMVHNRPWGEIVEKKDYRYPTAYRYIGSPQKQQEWTNEYNNKYGTQRSNGRLGVTARWAEGGFLQPRDAWDRLSIAEQAAMMKAAVSEGIFDLSEIRKRYNEFAEGGNIYSGEEEKTQQMEKRPITTGGAGYIPPTSDIDIRQRLYDNIVPFGYKHPVERLVSAIVLNTPSKYEEMPTSGNYDALDELWATYLQIPKDKRHYDPVLKKSKYRPTKEKDLNTIYYSLPLHNDEKQDIVISALEGKERLRSPELAASKDPEIVGFIRNNTTVAELDTRIKTTQAAALKKGMTVDEMLDKVPEKELPVNTQELIQIYGRKNPALRKMLKKWLVFTGGVYLG